jgi:hypothetical protein
MILDILKKRLLFIFRIINYKLPLYNTMASARHMKGKAAASSSKNNPIPPNDQGTK